jgi:hypothetical protein
MIPHCERTADSKLHWSESPRLRPRVLDPPPYSIRRNLTKGADELMRIPFIFLFYFSFFSLTLATPPFSSCNLAIASHKQR